MSDVLKRHKPYPLSDRLSLFEKRKFAAPFGIEESTMGLDQWCREYIRAVWTGERRIPKKGEWYLSGSEIVAYRAPNDLTMQFHIARLVRIERVVTEIIHEWRYD